MSQKVYYYHVKANILISRTEIKDRMETLKETTVLFHKYEGPSKIDGCYAKPQVTLSTYEYLLSEIPLHEDWQTIVIDDVLTLDLEEYGQLYEMSYRHAPFPLLQKLRENIHTLREFEYKGIKFY